MNLLKGVVSKILGLFGLEKAEEAVADFSFTTLIKDLAGLVWTTLRNIVGWFADLITGETSFSETIGNIGSVIDDFIRGVLRAGLPDPSQPWYKQVILDLMYYLNLKKTQLQQECQNLKL